MQIWFYSRYGVRLFHNVEEDNTKPFDVFISYCHQDMEYVGRVLYPGLRDDYSVCIDERNFRPGYPIANAIDEAVEQSKRTLNVVSTNFLNSEYGKLEFRKAHHKSLQDRFCRLIVLLLEDVDQRTMDPEMRAYFRTNLYLRTDHPDFWRKNCALLCLTLIQGNPTILLLRKMQCRKEKCSNQRVS